MGQCLGKGASKGAAQYDSNGQPQNGHRGKKGQHVDHYKPPTIDEIAVKLGMPGNAAERERGCYLVFDPASGGVLNAQWSESTVEGAWAFFFPRVPVAGFKFKQNGGKNELIRGLAVNKQKVYSGWAQFFKLAFDNDAVLSIFDRADGQADFWYLDEKMTVNPIPKDEFFEAKMVSVVAIIPKHNQYFKGIQKTTEEAFLDTAKRAMGHTWKPLRK